MVFLDSYIFSASMKGIILAVFIDPVVFLAGMVIGLANKFLMQMATLEEPSLISIEFDVVIACSE